MKNKVEIMRAAYTVLYVIAVAFFVLSIVSVISDNGIVQPAYLLVGAIALGAANLIRNGANKQNTKGKSKK